MLSSSSDVMMLILSNFKVERSSFQSEKEISISYGNKGNEVLFLVIQKLYFLPSCLCEPIGNTILLTASWHVGHF